MSHLEKSIFSSFVVSLGFWGFGDKRLNMIEEYSINIDSLLAGADKNEIKLKHWSLKIVD